MKIELELEVVTPLIMSGADQGKFELREQSINGAMRYWYRKIYGTSAEAELFGSSEKRGKFTVRIPKQTDFETKKVHKDLKIMVETKTGRSFPDTSYGRNYLLGLLIPSKKNDFLDRSAATSGRFTLLLNCVKCSEDEWRQLLGSLWASIYIGGWGARSRRGFGSLRVFESNVEQGKLFIPSEGESFYKNAFEYFEFKNTNFEVYIIENLDFNKFQKNVENSTKFHNGEYKRFSNRARNIRIPARDPVECLDVLGSVMQYFRSYLLPDYDIAKAAVQKGQKLNAKEIWRSDFGTPIMFRFRKTGTTSVRDRIPSRLFLRVLKTDRGCYPVLVFDKSRLRVSEKDKNKPNDLVKIFLNVLSVSGTRKVIP